MKLSNYMEDLLYRVNELDPDLAADIRQEHFREMAIAQGELDVERAHANLQNIMAEYDDPTGQDLDGPEVEGAARDYVDAQDQLMRERDPERWAEKRFGA